MMKSAVIVLACALMALALMIFLGAGIILGAWGVAAAVEWIAIYAMGKDP